MKRIKSVVKSPEAKVKGLRIAMCCFILCAFSFKLSAQTFAEWFSQGSTQKKYLLEQIAALQVYAGYLEKGYKIAESGWGTVRDISQGELGLHSAFYDALKVASPAVRNDARVAEVAELELYVLRALSGIRDAPVHTGYIRAVSGVVTTACLGDLSELLLVTGSGEAELKDEERLRRLDGVARRMRDKAAFTRYFVNEVKVMLAGQAHELNETELMRRFYDIN